MLISPRSSQRKQPTFRDVTKAFPAKVKSISQRSELLLETNLVEKEPWDNVVGLTNHVTLPSWKFDKNFTPMPLMYVFILTKSLHIF